jgi:fido (protein-threonine AMPylation protein)
VQDAERTYSQVELEALSENLLALVDSVYRGEFSLEPASRGLLCEFHRRAFDKVRDFAGLNRNQNYGNDYLNYYGNLR